MNLIVALSQFLLVMIPHVIALPAVVVFRCRWGVNHATVPRFIIGWIMAMPLMLVTPLVLGSEKLNEALKREVTRSWKFMGVFGVISTALFLAGRIRLAMRPPSGLSNDVGRVRFLPRGTFWQMVPTVALTGLAIADWCVWKELRPLSALGAFYGLMMAWDYLRALSNDRAMRVGVNDAVILSDQVKPPQLEPNSHPAKNGEGGTGELVRIYGRSGRR
jgi:hypothetical protein